MMRLPIGFVLAAAMGLTLILATGGTVGYLSLVATDSTRTLIADKGRLTRDRAFAQVAADMQRIRDQAHLLQNLITAHEDGSGGQPIAPDDLAGLARSLLSATPAPAGILYRAADGATLAIGPGPEPAVAGVDVAPADALPADPNWGGAFRMPAGGPLGLPYILPLGDGRTVTLLLDLDRLSQRLAAAAGDDPQVSFLIDADTMVLAHSQTGAVRPGDPLGQAGPDPVLDLIAHPSPARRPMPGLDNAILDRRDGPMYALFYRTIPDAPGARLIAGVYFQAQDLGAEGDEIDTALYISAGLLVLVVFGAFLLGNRIGRPIRGLAAVAKRMETLAVKDAPRLPRSHLREIDDANQAVNAAIGGLGAFSRYVPRDLVLRLLRPDAIGAVQSTARTVTVLFTDIAGYTAASGRMSAEETAAFLNHHFELLTACVETEGGTVDKFIGDSLMAFWGAPQPQPDHAARAARSALAMAVAFRDDPVMAQAGVRLRIGLHSGPVVVGNIGATSRTSYTAIGDAVNVAARLEQLGKQIDDAAPVIVLTSAETNVQLPGALQGASLGAHRLRGRDEETEVVRLV